MTAPELLPLIRELFSRCPEYRANEPWELQSLLWSLGYADELEGEAEIEDALEVVLGDWTGEAA
jgi:hypothetical protein